MPDLSIREKHEISDGVDRGNADYHGRKDSIKPALAAGFHVIIAGQLNRVSSTVSLITNTFVPRCELGGSVSFIRDCFYAQTHDACRFAGEEIRLVVDSLRQRQPPPIP